MNAALRQAIADAITEATGERFDDFTVAPAGGGDINQTFRIQKGSLSYFLKLNASAPLSMFEAERAALEILGATRSIRVPRPVACGEINGSSFLALEFLSLNLADSDGSLQKLGEQLANLHRHVSTEGLHGWSHANYIGSTPQPNTPCQDWVSFWREKRLAHQFRLAAADGHRLEDADLLLDRLDSLLAGHNPAPSLLHGDLWGGNFAFTDDQDPVLYDPASYYGDRETDLAMTRLFSELPSAFYDAYHAAYPLPPGHETRGDLYNLYHVLNHAHLFGGHYPSQAQSMINRLVSR